MDYEDRYRAGTPGCNKHLNAVECVSLTLGFSRPPTEEVVVALCLLWRVLYPGDRDSHITSTNKRMSESRSGA